MSTTVSAHFLVSYSLYGRYVTPVFPQTFWLINKRQNFVKTIVSKAVKMLGPVYVWCAANFAPIQYR